MCKRKSNFGIFVWDCDLCNNAGIPLPRLERGREAGAEMGWHCTVALLNSCTVNKCLDGMAVPICTLWTLHSLYNAQCLLIISTLHWICIFLRDAGAETRWHCLFFGQKKNCLFLILRFVEKDWSSWDGLAAPFVYCIWRRGSFDRFLINPAALFALHPKNLCVGAGGACCAGRRGDGADFTGSPTKKDWSRPQIQLLVLFSYFYEKCIFYRAIKHKGLKPTVVLCVTFTMRHFPFLKILIYTWTWVGLSHNVMWRFKYWEKELKTRVVWVGRWYRITRLMVF